MALQAERGEGGGVLRAQGTGRGLGVRRRAAGAALLSLS